MGDDGVCEDPAEATRRAPVTCWAVVTTSEMAWWVEKASTALAAGMHAAGQPGADMGLV